MYKPLPIGVEFFEKIRSNDYYYVDKTLFIKELIDKKGEVNLFTRPRRFGKTLTLDMLRCFFEEGRDPSLFEGLKIMEAGEKYTSQMNRYPVIKLTLKSAKQNSFRNAFLRLREEIIGEFSRHLYLAESDKLNEEMKSVFMDLYRGLSKWREKEDLLTAEEEEKEIEKESGKYAASLKTLSECLKAHHHKNVIILIDEYDVPLESSYYGGFYDRMAGFIRSLFESALKTNDCLEFAVITGCLRISKESIFTGLNNLKINSIMTPNFGEYFGFTDDEVKTMLDHYELSDKYEEVRRWYNGYIFGEKNVYNPWSSIMYISDHTGANRDYFPKSYWANTSSNSVVKDLIERADSVTKSEIENLIAGGSIEIPVHEDITYDEIYEKQDNLWNFMFFTGYLKAVASRYDAENDITYATLVIPNREARYIYSQKIINWFDQEIVKKTDRNPMFEAMRSGDAAGFEKEVNKLLRASISYMDSYENFYHGFMAGILIGSDDFSIKSNRESGDGRSDIQVIPVDPFERAFVIELKTVKPAKGESVTMEMMDSVADEALRQIEDMNYMDALKDTGFSIVGRYGISFFRKRCRVHYVEGYPGEG